MQNVSEFTRARAHTHTHTHTHTETHTHIYIYTYLHRDTFEYPEKDVIIHMFGSTAFKEYCKRA